jgi:hypothetical protein
MNAAPCKILLIIGLLIVQGCSQPGRVSDTSGVEYSEYYQCLLYSNDRALSFDAFITLGNERLPSSYSLTNSQKQYLSSPDTILSVNEVYLRNHGDATIKVTDLVIAEGRGSFSRQYSPSTIELPSGAVVLSDPIVDVTSVYGPNELPCSISYKNQGKSYTINGTWRRLTIDELKR